MAGWANEQDLFTGTLNTDGLDTAKYVDAAYEEMLVELGKVYVLPLPSDGSLGPDIVRILKFIHQRIASARLLLDVAAVQENNELHAYGLHLLNEGRGELCQIGSMWEIPGTQKIGTRGEDRTPRVVGGDAFSPFTIYENYVHGHGTDVVRWE